MTDKVVESIVFIGTIRIFVFQMYFPTDIYANTCRIGRKKKRKKFGFFDVRLAKKYKIFSGKRFDITCRKHTHRVRFGRTDA